MDKKDIHLGTVYKEVPLLPREYDLDISVSLTRENKYFEKVHDVEFEFITHYEEFNP